MTGKVVDPDVRLLASISAALVGDYVDDEEEQAWAGSPFRWIIHLRSSRQRGKVAEQLVAGWCAAKGLSVGPSGDSDADRVIAGRRVEIKSSSLWRSGVYTFQQFRDQDYEYGVCLGISPFDAHCWVMPKELIMTKATPQHGGGQGRDTRWLSFPAAEPPDWLRPYGGTLAQAFRVLSSIRKG